MGIMRCRRGGSAAVLDGSQRQSEPDAASRCKRVGEESLAEGGADAFDSSCSASSFPPKACRGCCGCRPPIARSNEDRRSASLLPGHVREPADSKRRCCRIVCVGGSQLYALDRKAHDVVEFGCIWGGSSGEVRLRVQQGSRTNGPEVRIGVRAEIG